MKNIFFPVIGMITLCLCLSLNSKAAGKKDLPATIQSKIASRYPNSHIKGWEMKNNHYMVKIEDEKKKMITWYSTAGNWMRTEEKVPLSKDLPTPVRSSFDGGPYKDWHIDNIKEVTARNTPVMYVLHVDNGSELDSNHYDADKTDVVLYYNTDGSLSKTMPWHRNQE